MDQIPKYEPSDNPRNVPITVQNWQPFWQIDLNYDVTAMIWFLDASKRDADEVQRILDQAKDFDTLKKELSGFVNDRRDLHKDIISKMDSDEPEKWGFPRTFGKPDLSK